MHFRTRLEQAYAHFLTDPTTSDHLAAQVLHASRVIVNRLASSSLDRNDLVSLVTAAVWRKLSTGKIEPARVLPLLVAITRRKIADAWRKHYRHAETSLTCDVLGQEAGLGRAEGLLTLPEPHRSTIHSLMGSDSVAAAAASLGITPRTMNRRVRQAREAAEKAGVSING